MIIWTAFIIGRVCSSTEYTFSRSVSWFCATAGIMLPAAFDTCIWLVAIPLSMAIVLTSNTLRYVNICVWRFNVDYLILDGCQVVDVLVVICWLAIYEEHV